MEDVAPVEVYAFIGGGGWCGTANYCGWAGINLGGGEEHILFDVGDGVAATFKVSYKLEKKAVVFAKVRVLPP
jgi:hypothetical protein